MRHGPSGLALPAGRVGREDLLAWRVRYDASGIAEGASPPEALRRLASRARVVSSDLLRAQESAARLAGSGPVEFSPLLRELDLPVPGWFPGHMPALAWEALTHMEWFWARLFGRDALPEHLAQARDAAAWLEGRAEVEQPLVAVTHGVVRRLIARELEESGWRRQGRFRSYDHWSVWLLARLPDPG